MKQSIRKGCRGAFLRGTLPAVPVGLREAQVSKIGSQKNFSLTSNFKCTGWLQQWEGWYSSVSNGGFLKAGLDEKKAALL